MFSSLAWLRAFTFGLLFLTSYAHAREESIYTSSVTYCNPPETLLISRFEVAYFPQNQSVSFNVSAASVQANVSVVGNILINVYGMKPVNVTLDFCNILGGALCPLPMYNFTGADSITLPESLGVASKIPGIAFKIPDLEGYAQLTLTEANTGVVKACVQATLANGWSTHQKAVEWSTGGVALAALLVSLGMSLLAADSIAPFRLLELVSLYQTIASSALLSLNYPSIYRAFALNFSWALGLFPTSDSSAIQNSINTMRHRTGGKLVGEISGSAVQYVNRRLSPYNDPPTLTALATFATPLSGYVKRQAADLVKRFNPHFPTLPPFPANDVSLLAKRATINGDVQTVTSGGSNVLQAGLPIYVNTVHVSTLNAFMTVFLCALMMFAIGLAALAIGYGLHILYIRRKGPSSESPFNYIALARSWILRLSLIAFAPLTIFIFYQWTLKDSWTSVLLSVLALLAIAALVGWPVFTTIRFARTRGLHDLYTQSEPQFASTHPLYGQYRVRRYWFFLVTLSATFVRAILIAFAKKQATAQISLIVALEGLLFLSYVVLKPFPTRGGDVFGTYLAIVRFVCTGLMIGFLQPLNVNPIPRVVVGIVIVLIYAVAVLVVIGNFVLNVLVFFLKKGGRVVQGDRASEESGSLEGSVLEKGEKAMVKEIEKENEVGDVNVGVPTDEIDSEVGHVDSSMARSSTLRPDNPTPSHTQATLADTSILQPFPISPTGTTVSTMDPPSLSSSKRTSGTLTVGSLLPRRWSFQWSHSQPNSPAGSSGHGQYSSEFNTPSSSPGYTWSTDGYLSRRTSDSMGAVAGASVMSASPSAWTRRPSSSSGGVSASVSVSILGSSSVGSSQNGHLTRQSSMKVYQASHGLIPENSTS